MDNRNRYRRRIVAAGLLGLVLALFQALGDACRWWPISAQEPRRKRKQHE